MGTSSGYLRVRVRGAAEEFVPAVTSSGLAFFGIVLLLVGCISVFVSLVRESVGEIAIRMVLGATGGRSVGRPRPPYGRDRRSI